MSTRTRITMDSHREKKTPRSAIEAAAADSGLAMEKERVEGDLKRLKAKTRALLAQYDKKKTVIAAQVLQEIGVTKHFGLSFSLKN